jgi:hypothetical protein
MTRECGGPMRCSNSADRHVAMRQRETLSRSRNPPLLLQFGRFRCACRGACGRRRGIGVEHREGPGGGLWVAFRRPRQPIPQGRSRRVAHICSRAVTKSSRRNSLLLRLPAACGECHQDYNPIDRPESAPGHSLHSRSLPMRFFVRYAPNSDHSIAGVANDATGQLRKLSHSALTSLIPLSMRSGPP